MICRLLCELVDRHIPEASAVTQPTPKPGRVARGLKHHLCFQCQSGIVPGQAKTFEPSCAGCQEKLAKGLRTGNEPRPMAKGSRNGMVNVGSGYNPGRAARKNLQTRT